MAAQHIIDQQELIFYKNIVEAFFDQHYPELEKEKFWEWIVFTLTGKAKTLDALQAEEIQAFSSQLEKLGKVLYDPRHFMEGFTNGKASHG
ncbi:hypothetical protein SNE26_17590 [Mucilaginibacter sp. cycad4]|uniref:hypothetical protein n=1 Tax=Mucilaginibacter sp. cycad4 TaxID=3342096 RepID=UPI002AAB210F|nr:hypothetical protein [Mucilaginibacter gossypii]WPU97842.1 hypothetical protein SNE26_17590 [Mucilaginibacter gossypii]